jgi:hypothetical protein
MIRQTKALRSWGNATIEHLGATDQEVKDGEICRIGEFAVELATKLDGKRGPTACEHLADGLQARRDIDRHLGGLSSGSARA